MCYFGLSGYDDWKTSPPPEAPEIDHCFGNLRIGVKKLDGTVLEIEARAMLDLAADEFWVEACDVLQVPEDEILPELVEDYTALFDLLDECKGEVEEVWIGGCCRKG